MNCGTATRNCFDPPGTIPVTAGQHSGGTTNSDNRFQWSQWSQRISSLNAPREDGGKLIEPPLELAGDMAAANRWILERADYDVQGRRLTELAADARAQLFGEAQQFTRGYRDVDLPKSCSQMFLAGHQPEMFHPGVWFKNFVLARLAQQHGAVAINLVIDSDDMKTASIRVPSGSIEKPRLDWISFDRPSVEMPFEQRGIADRNLFASFGQRVARQIQPLVPEPILKRYWPLVLARAKSVNNVGACLAQARHQLEEQWKLQTLEIPQSRVCDLPALRWFIIHILAQLPRFRAVYNAALVEYRHAHKLRSAAHPAPDLAADGDWLESPFWIWSEKNPLRRRLFVRQRGAELLLSDRAGLEESLSIRTDGDAATATEQLLALAERGIRIRTRALITTMAARLLLGDLFLHGIGGAKYDQVTDRLITGFFGLEPPGYLVASGTLHLPVAHGQCRTCELLDLRQRIRELEFHPERFLDETSNAATAADPIRQRRIAEKRRWIAAEPTLENARIRCRAIRQVNESLQPEVAGLRQRWSQQADELSRKLRGEAILTSREYAFVLFPELLLTNFFQ